jgi:hypothetical protein
VKLGLKRISCASQLTIPDTAATHSDLAGKNTDTRSSKPNQAIFTPDFPYPLVSSIFVPILIPHLPFSTIIAGHQVNSSLSISPCHDHELTLSAAYTQCSIHPMQHTPNAAYTQCSIHPMQHTPNAAYTQCSIHPMQHTPSTAYPEYSIHRVQHTPSTAYTENSIHRVQHTPSTVHTQNCLSSRHSHDHELTPECSLSFRNASLQDRLPPDSSP